jgi:hypothetical protein
VVAQLSCGELKNVSIPIAVYKIMMPWGENEMDEDSQFDRKRIAILPFSISSRFAKLFPEMN